MSKPKKRSRPGNGTVYSLGDGRYQAAISYTVWVDGKKKRARPTRTAPSRELAEIYKKELIDEKARYKNQRISNITLGDYLERWMKTAEFKELATATKDSYATSIRLYLQPGLGTVTMRTLTAMDIKMWLQKMSEKSNRSTQNSMARTIENAYVVLSVALAAAVLDETILENPILKVTKPKYTEPDVFPFTPNEVARIFEVIEHRRYCAAYWLGLKAGLRVGEILGLQWNDINWQTHEIRVTRQACETRGKVEIKPPKSQAGVRTITVTAQTIAKLHERKKASVKEGFADCPWVFPNNRGGISKRSNFTRHHWAKLFEKRLAGIEPRGFHHTRHTYVTMTLAAGVPVHVISPLIGHAKPSTTLDIYSHLMQGDGKRAAAAIARATGEVG